MKNFTVLLILLSSAGSYAQVKVVTNYNKYDYFPTHWLRPAVNASAEPISKRDAKKAMIAIRRFALEYPSSVLNKYLEGVYLVSKFRFYNNDNLRFGATYYNRRIFIKYKTSGGDHIKFTQRHLHHEFSSILMNKNYFPRYKWEKHNLHPYKSKNEGIDCLSTSGDGRDEHGYLFRKGYLTSYGSCYYENDINIYAEYVFLFPNKLERIGKKYPRVKRKTKVIKEFYCKISNKFHFCEG